MAVKNPKPIVSTPTAPRLLVVDDELNARLGLSRRLVKRGYCVDTAEGGTQALDKIQNHHYDLVLLDQRMPEMNGVDLLRLLRATYSSTDLPVIMVTGVDESKSIVEALEEGANDYLVKPVEIGEIHARIQTQLTRSKSIRKVKSSGHRSPFEYPEAIEAEWSWDAVEAQAQWSPEWKALLGYRDDEVGRELSEWLERVHPQDLMKIHKEMKAHLTGGAREFRCEHRLRCKNGYYLWVLCRGMAERSAGGDLVRFSGRFTDIEERKAVDALTGLGNRLRLLDRLSVALTSTIQVRSGMISMCDLSGSTLAGSLSAHEPAAPESLRSMVLLLDLDGFKSFNATAGHEAADELLREVADRLRQAVGNSIFGRNSTVARIGNDEFAILVASPNAPSASGVTSHGVVNGEGLANLAGRGGIPAVYTAGEIAALGGLLLQCLAKPISVGGELVRVAVSAGIAVCPPGGATADDMLRDADLALRTAREQGGNCWCLFEPGMRGQEHIRAAVVRDLRYAVERKELVAYYQPQVDLRTRRIYGFEALLRWRHPEHGLLPPGEFIPLAEATGFIVPAGEWILREACQQLKLWQQQFPMEPPLLMSVNLSVRQLSDPHLVSVIRRTLKDTGLSPRSLKLELTESSLIGEKDTAREVLAAIQSMGVGLMLDDFGTGYASLSYLNVMKFDALKIDRSFVMRMDAASDEGRAIIKTILGLAQQLNMGVVAEGIEQERHIEMLLDMGCDFGQGYFFSKPLIGEGATKLLKENYRRAASPVLPSSHPDSTTQEMLAV